MANMQATTNKTDEIRNLMMAHGQNHCGSWEIEKDGKIYCLIDPWTEPIRSWYVAVLDSTDRLCDEDISIAKAYRILCK